VSGSELLLPDRMTVRGAGEALAARLGIANGAQREGDRAYYDTFDGLLYGAGLSLLHADGRLSLIERDTGVVRATLPRPAPGGPLFASELPPGSLRDTLLSLTDIRAVLPVAHVHARERDISVIDDEGKTVVRLALEEPVVVESEGSRAVLRPRLRITGVRGYDEERERVEAALVDELGFKPVEELLVDEAVRATGGVPGGFPAKIEAPLEFDQSAAGAVATVLRMLLEVIEANLPGTIDDLDSEFLHDLRVSVRRSRAVQRELKGVFEPAELARFRAEFRWLQQASGDARDLDVHVLEFDSMRALVPEAMRSDLDPLLDVLRARRVQAHRRLVSALRSERATGLLTAWEKFLDELDAGSDADRPDAAQPIGVLAGERIRKVYRQMVRMGDAIDDSSPAEDYHELRKKGKELRYLLELFGAPLYPSEVVKPMVRTLKALQDVLGRHQDREVQVALLRSLGPDVAKAPRGEAALMAMGALIARLSEDEAAARGEFAARFAEFASSEQRRLVKETFAP
jgi:CHAD domain-containing protein